MLTEAHNARRIGRVAMAAATVLLCMPAAWAHSQHSSAPAPQPARPQTYRPQSSWPRNQGQPAVRPQGRPQAYAPQRPAFGYPTPHSAYSRPGYPGSGYPGPSYRDPGHSRPTYPGYAPPVQGPSSPLGNWLNQHHNLPAQEQERILRGDPNFRRLPPSEQQRVVQQLHQVDQLSEEQRQRRLARAEMIDRLPPQQRMQINLSARRWAALPVDRQAIMKRAFQDLRAVPLDQRPTVLNSARYQGVFSPEERGILSDMLRVEPYQPVR
jgi:hypothetical protein